MQKPFHLRGPGGHGQTCERAAIELTQTLLGTEPSTVGAAGSPESEERPSAHWFPASWGITMHMELLDVTQIY